MASSSAPLDASCEIIEPAGPVLLVGGNEAGMLLSGEIRGADAAVWRKEDVGAYSGKLRRVPPVLAAEVAGQDEGEVELRDKARWYLAHGVCVVWLVLPDSFEVIVIDRAGESRHGIGAELPARPELPGLKPSVARLFAQIRS